MIGLEPIRIGGSGTSVVAGGCEIIGEEPCEAVGPAVGPVEGLFCECDGRCEGCVNVGGS